MNFSLNLRDRSPAVVALAAGALAFGLNQVGLPVFGGTEMVGGGAVTLLATYLLGPWWGALASALGFSVTWLTWGHPWGLLCCTLEAFVVGWLTQRRHLHPLRGALLYWGLVGGPLIALAVFGFSDAPFPSNWAVIIKYPANSLLMAMIALPVYQSHRFRLAAGLPLERNSDTPLQHILFRRLGLIIALSIAALCVFAGGVFDRTLRDSARDELASKGREVAIETQAYLDRHLRAVTHLADLCAVADLANAARPDPLSRARALYPGFLNLLVTDQSGLVVAAWPARNRHNQVVANNGVQVGDHASFLVPRTTRRAYVSDIFRGPGHGDELAVALSAPIHNRNGDFEGVAEGSLDLQRLADAIGRAGQLHDRTVVIVDRTGRVVLRSGDINAEPLQLFSRNDLYFAARQGDSETFPFNHGEPGRREHYVATRHLVPGFGWQVYLAEPLWRTQRTIAEFYLACALVAAATIGVALLLARGTAGEITRPFTQLVAATHRIVESGGDAGIEEAVHPSRELAEISRELHSAAVSLGRTNRELASTVADRDQTHENLRGLLLHLEEKVQERTRELEIARRAAESASEAKSEFLASMSHELRTPLNVIVGMSELIGDGTLGPLNDRQTEGVRNVHESGRHLLDLINDILDLSKIEAGMLELHRESTDLAALCQASVRFVREAARAKDIAVEVTLHHHSPGILADERRLKQVLVNLLVNAVKFTPTGGRVGLNLHELPGRGRLRFEVWDTGIGIAAENFERIFQPFQQIDSSLARQYSGTGLGLTLVRRLTQLHGGTIDLQSEPGQGSRFGIEIPLVPEIPPEPADEDSALPVISTRARILIAEDNESNHAVYSAFFLPRGCELRIARNGLEAVELALEHRPDLILMDVQMPVMDGLEATRLLRCDPRTERTPIIAVTALAMPEDRIRCLEAGANAYLCKPINLRELARLVARFTNPVDQPAELAPLP